MFSVCMGHRLYSILWRRVLNYKVNLDISCDCRVSPSGTSSIHGSFRSPKQLFVLLISVFEQEHRWVLLLQGFGPFASQLWGSALFLWHSSGGYSEARKTHSVQIILLLRKSVTWQAFIYIP